MVLPLNLSASTGPESGGPPGEHQQHQHQLVRTLGLMDIIMIGIAGMIGGAIFVLTGSAIGLAGSAVILAFIINAIITLFTAMAYAELGSAMPEAGGGYLWIREGLPRPNAFISGWMAWFAHIVAGSLYAVGYGSFQFSLLQMLGIIGDQPLFGFIPVDKLIAVLSIAAFAYVNVKGASETGKLGISKAAEIFLPYGSFIILAGGIVSSFAALNATTYSSARVAFAMGRHYNLPHQLSNIHHKFKTPYLATIISAIIMAVMAYALPLDQIALAIYLLFTQPTSWLISVLWIAIGFAVYRIYTFRKEIEHYAPIVTSEGDLARKHFRILIPYTPENPDRLTKYAVRVAKENDGEINILRVITVPHQTPLSAGTAFTERAAKDFEPLEKTIDKENILNHYFVRISHEANEAILSTIEEQRIDLLIMDYETLRRNKALQTLATCNMLAILTGGLGDEELALEDSIADRRNRKKSLVVLYDGGDHSDMVLKTASWLEHSGKFKTTILSIKKKEEGKHIGYSRIDNQDIRYKKDKEKERHVKYLEQIGVEFREVFVTDLIRNNSQEFCQLILSSINASQPDMLVAGKRIGKFSVFDNEYFVSLLERLNCPVIVARSFVIPGLSKMRSSLMKAIYHR